MPTEQTTAALADISNQLDVLRASQQSIQENKVSPALTALNKVQAEIATNDAAISSRVFPTLAQNALIDLLGKSRDVAVDNFDAAKSEFAAATATVNALIPQQIALENTAASETAAADPTSTVKDTASTNPSASDADTTAKYDTVSTPISASTPTFNDRQNETQQESPAPLPVTYGSNERLISVPAGAEPRKPVSATMITKDKNGKVAPVDLRVKIRVPKNYLTTSLTSGMNKELEKLGGIIFPYTPAINYEHKADYSPANPTHSNFTIYSYKSSSISAISIVGKFTVQTDADAGVYLATVHLLRALTKMRSGGITGDSDSGAPPPVCRLDAYGDAMLANVPVAITSFRVDLPDNVDYYNLGPTGTAFYGPASVPTIATITISCIPMYSRREMQNYSVTSWLDDFQVRKNGLL